MRPVRTLIRFIAILIALIITIVPPVLFWSYISWLWTTPQGLLSMTDYVLFVIWVTVTMLSWLFASYVFVETENC